MKTWSPTQHACLEAMGIDVWVPRHALTVVKLESEKLAVEAEVDQRVDTPAIQNTRIETTIVSPAVESIITPVTAVPEEPATRVVSDFEIPSGLETSPKLEMPDDWNGLQQAVSTCQHCELHSTRSQTVFGAGSQNASWLIIGDTPSAEDDKTGQPFSGQSGELLTAMLRAIKLTRQHVYISNTLKCTTPNNREPESVELETCLQYLQQQIALLKPKLILVLGQSAAQRILNTHSTLARLRQKIHTLEGSDIPVIVTYHPASLLSMPANKGKAWQDLLFAQKTISTDAVL